RSWPASASLTAARLRAGEPAPSKWRRAARGQRVQRSREARGGALCGCELFAEPAGRPGRGPRRDGRAGTSRRADPLWWARGLVECRHATFGLGYGLSKNAPFVAVRTDVL